MKSFLQTTMQRIGCCRRRIDIGSSSRNRKGSLFFPRRLCSDGGGGKNTNNIHSEVKQGVKDVEQRLGGRKFGPDAMKGPLTWAALGIIAFIGTGVVYYYEVERKKRMEKVFKEVAVTGKPDLGGPFVLVDHRGVAVTDATYRGQYMLLYFGFAHCPDICPSELVKVGKIADEIGKKKNLPYKLKPVFVTVDPNRDCVAVLRHYAQDFHSTIDYLTGTNEQIAKIARAYRVYFSKVDEDEEGDYLVDHSIVLYLVSPEGEFLDFFTQRMQVTDIVERIGDYMTGKKK